MATDTPTFSLFLKNKFSARITRLLIFITLLALLLFGLKIRKIFAFTVMPLSQQQWPEQPGLVAVQHRNNTTTILSVYRLADGKEEPIKGAWQTHFTRPEEMFIYGNFPADEEHQRLFVLTQRGGEIKNISGLPGPISSIDQSPAGAYVLVNGIKTKGKPDELYSCVAPKESLAPCRLVLGDILPTKLYSSSSLFYSHWNQAHERELLIDELGGSRQHFRFDPWEENAVPVTSSTSTTLQPMKQFYERYIISRWWRITTITDTRSGKKTYLFLSPRSTLLWVSSDLLLTCSGNHASLINVNNRTKSAFVNIPCEAMTAISYYSEQMDRSRTLKTDI